jgi:phosphatidylethanolamine/phosphatidyl-N-methylethanolamine N-methyltransferase
MPSSPNRTEDRSPGTSLGLFWRRWISDPKGIGAVAPSSPGLTRRMAREVVLREGEVVVELGPGTGTVTQALIKAGIPEDRLILVELDPEMHAFLVAKFPEATVLQGDAADLNEIIPPKWRGRVSAVVSSLPLLSIPLDVRRRIALAVFQVMAPKGHLIQFTYSPFSPLRNAVPDLKSERTGFAAFNIPPATVWRYTSGEGGGKTRPRAAAS